MSPLIGGRLAWPRWPGSGVALRMSPSRSIDSRTCWKSCHNCARRSTGAESCAAIMLNATSSPTVSWFSMTSLAPKNRIRTVSSLLIRVALCVAKAPRPTTRKAADIAGDLLLPAQLQHRLERHRLDGLDPGDRLDQKGLVLGIALELLVEPGAEDRGDAEAQHDVERQGGRDDQHQGRAVDVEDAEKDRGEKQVEDQGQC